jgi:hypothetical protein
MGICSFSAYCVNTGLGTYSQFDGIYSATGVYNTYLYYTGDTTPVSYLYYFTSVTLDNRWCLSTSLGGSCILFGRTPCLSDCPDLDGSYFNENICPTPTPTMTPHCELDFSSIFDCNVIPTPTPTVTTTSTPTPTPTVTPTIACPVYADVSINIFPPDPSPTPTPTPTTTPTGYCDNIIGVAYSTMLSGTVVCDQVNQYELCQTSTSNPKYYYTSSGAYLNGSGATVGLYYTAYIDSYSTTTCLKYLGVVPNVGSESSITLIDGPFNDCSICFPTPTPTPSPTITPTITRTPTPTPSMTPAQEDIYVFKKCDQDIYVVESANLLNTPFPLGSQSLVNYPIFSVQHKTNSGGIVTDCWEFVGSYGGTITNPPLSLVPSGSYSTIWGGPYDFFYNNLGSPSVWYGSCIVNFPSTPYSDCNDCLTRTNTP